MTNERLDRRPRGRSILTGISSIGRGTKGVRLCTRINLNAFLTGLSPVSTPDSIMMLVIFAFEVGKVKGKGERK